MSLDLSQLFDAPCYASSGEVRPKDVADLGLPYSDECPPSFPGWVEKRRREFLAGRYHARQALALSGVSAGALLKDPDGVPVFPPGVSGSITHTGRETTFAAAVVTTSGAELGLDAEERRDLPQDMASYVLTAEEQSSLDRLPPRLRVDGLGSTGELSLLAFSAKEAFYKAIFPRLRCRLGFHDVRFELREVEIGTVPWRGSFDLVAQKCAPDAIPERLSGRFLMTPRFFVCGVTWKRR